jgi:23S rRNA (adenine2030-N6)-methyltransferase
MLSYRHGFHAGNHADVLKHLVEVLILDHFLRKETPFLYVDTHAGAGMYDLDDRFASQNAEYRSGISKIQHARRELPAELRLYLETIDRCCDQFGKDIPHCYPGSPLVALQMLRDKDKAHFFELHPADCDLLQKQAYRHAKITLADGLAGLKALLPPASRRAFVLIDPPYEDKRDYRTVVDTLHGALKRFATGVYAVWYPLLPKGEHRDLVEGLRQLSPEYYLKAELAIHDERGDYGMYGSGMFVINPPWKLAQQLESALPVLDKLLSEEGQGGQTLEFRQP